MQSSYASAAKQGGVVLIEALVSILIFSIGLLTLVALQALSAQSATDAKFRTNAEFLGNQIIGQMWADPANIGTYALNANAPDCTGAAPAGAHPTVTWATEVDNLLPGTNGGQHQKIEVNPASGDVIVTICWRSVHDAQDHQHKISSNIGINQ